MIVLVIERYSLRTMIERNNEECMSSFGNRPYFDENRVQGYWEEFREYLMTIIWIVIKQVHDRAFRDK